MASASDAHLMKPSGGIPCLLTSGRDSGYSSDRGFRTLAGAGGNAHHVVKAGAVESDVKASSTDSAEEEWIYIRGCRIKRSGLRFNSQGYVYVPDSEDDESAMDLAPAVAADKAVGLDLAPTMATDRAAGVDVVPLVAADGAASVEMNPDVAARLAKQVLGEDLHPEVAARLAEVLSKIEPFCHECFIGMYKDLVPIFFTPPP